MTILSFKQLPPKSKPVNVYRSEDALKNLKAVNLNGRVFWFYLFAPLNVHELHHQDKYKWSF